MTIFVPPRVARELAERTISYNADILASIEPEGNETCLRFSRMLADIHPRLLMVKAREQVVPGVAMKPGHYHILVRTDQAPWNAIPIEGEDGEFCEPTSRVFERLAQGDLRQPRNLERWLRDHEHEHDAVEREKVSDREERHDHLKQLIKAYTETSVPGVGQTWTQNQAGRRDAGERRKRRGEP